MAYVIIFLLAARVATEPSCSDTCADERTYNCPCRSELSTPKYEYAEEFVQYEIARELAMQAESNTKWVSLDAKTKTISYNEAADGSTIPDFSHVGYHGDGARSLPSRDDIPALATLMAASDGAGDDTARIQAALDEVGAAPMSSVNGYRGAVVLNAGTFRIADPLVMRHDGVVLRGAGVDETVLLATAPQQYTMVEVLGSSRPGVANSEPLERAKVVFAEEGEVVPIGGYALTIALASHLAEGDTVYVAVPVTDSALVETLRMDQMCFSAVAEQDKVTSEWSWLPSDEGATLQWDKGYRSCNACQFVEYAKKLSPTTSLVFTSRTLMGYPETAYQVTRQSNIYERTIANIDGNTLTFEEPLMQIINAKFGGAWVFPAKYNGEGILPMASRASGYRAKHVGVEDIELKSVYVEGKEASDEDHAWTAISLDNVEDAYVRGIRCRHIGFACVDVRDGSIRRRYAFNTEGTFGLMQNLAVDNGRHDYVSGSRAPGPNVWRNAISTTMQNDIGPHHRFSSGQLYGYENISATATYGGEFAVQNRASAGSGHGWAGNAVVFYNCKSYCSNADPSNDEQTRRKCYNAFTVDSPAAGAGINWAIGCEAPDMSASEDAYLRQGFRGNNLGLTAPCKADGTDAPYQCCVASRLRKMTTVEGTVPSPYSIGGHWQGNNAPLADIPSLYEQQLLERLGPHAEEEEEAAAEGGGVVEGGGGNNEGEGEAESEEVEQGSQNEDVTGEDTSTGAVEEEGGRGGQMNEEDGIATNGGGGGDVDGVEGEAVSESGSGDAEDSVKMQRSGATRRALDLLCTLASAFAFCFASIAL